MQVANVRGRLALVIDGTAVDVEKASHGRFEASVDLAYTRWAELHDWASAYTLDAAHAVANPAFGPPVVSPRQVFAVALNYRAHAAEAGRDIPDAPLVFTKYPSSIVGSEATVMLPTATVDFEAELVVVIGREASDVAVAQAWTHVAGITVGQDLSERTLQLAGPAPQFALGKSYPGFSPIGPVVVSVDELADPDDLEIGCRLATGEVLQRGRTSDLVFSVPELISWLSRICPLLPGDLIFTGTPAGVGMGRTPPRFLQPGDVLDTWIEGVGTLRTLIGPESSTSANPAAHATSTATA